MKPKCIEYLHSGLKFLENNLFFFIIMKLFVKKKYTIKCEDKTKVKYIQE